MAQTTLQAGDIVKLKSGGPEMTITEIISKTPKMMNQPSRERDVNNAKTKWFDGTTLEYGQFKEPELIFVRNENDGFLA